MSASKRFRPPYFVKLVNPKIPAIHHPIPVSSSLDASAPVYSRRTKQSGIGLAVNEQGGEEIVCITFMNQPEKWCGCGRYYYKRAWET